MRIVQVTAMREVVCSLSRTGRTDIFEVGEAAVRIENVGVDGVLVYLANGNEVEIPPHNIAGVEYVK